MTTDRPSAARTAALPPRSSATGPQSAPPADAFSALLGAAAPRTDDAPRSSAPRPRRDDAQRPQRADDAKPKAKPADEPKPEAATEVAEEPTEPTPRPQTTPDIFALQLASPLPATPAPAAPTGGAPLPGTATPAVEGESAPAIPAFPSLNLLGGAPAPVAPAAPVAAEPLTGEAAAAVAPGTPGGIPLPFLAGLTPVADTEVPNVELPAAPAVELPTETLDAPQPDVAVALPSNAGGGEQAGSDTPSQPNPQTPTPATQATKPADAPAPAAPTTAAQPVAQPAPVAPATPMPNAAGLQRAIPLYRAPESAAQLIQIAADRGITHAKLNLKPVELGGIEVRLQTTPQGVTAQLVADSADAAKLLTQAADDLRRDLESRDVNLLSLDVTTQQDYQQQQAGSKQADIFGDQLPGNVRNVRMGLQDDPALTESPAPADTSLVLPNGVLVDVLA
ncbi:flagellar hook-length control protein FliK [Solirubrobacter sp. CPCC 204708]|uniref:Flagellar hook-length control protein FliK n=1 Tax=Solirubrobacter deserti TaxID=2282478 RepID=A0ABT4RMJ9_9ACTN|nr:flagellar hook-length control protein FliK [Solirubrobacter deserti]MBE2316925.1 flagellar hook-length control protein FliK [Solirubrobacter deserti]MDA0139756.1 flagellar hook-length control protein FliK [Solirubrobacter deserti]